MKPVEEQLGGPQHAGVVAETLNCQRQEAPQSTSQRCETGGGRAVPINCRTEHPVSERNRMSWSCRAARKASIEPLRTLGAQDV